MPSADHRFGPQNLGAPARPVQRQPPGRSPEHAEPARFIPHVQGLRAIAVLMVVLYHFWPGRLSGGYVGVDVFFVISGFLITAHLMRELQQTGGVRLAQFWARRARRLLPAALLVLLFSAIVVSIPALFPLSGLPAEIREILAATFYVENWYLALSSADYLALTGEPTTVQHYWSLSLEEQFYLMWPLILLAAAWAGVRWFSGDRRRAAVLAIAVVTAASLVFNIVFTITDPAPAYFVTFGRMWQFGVGALIALVPMLRVRHAVGSFVLGWGGIGALLYAAFAFDGQTPFPGYMALIPTLGAAAVIAASRTEHWWYPTRVLSVRPAQFVGDISYSLYLWHWPLIVIAPSVPFWGLTIYHRVALLALCFVLAWLTKRFVEDPVRAWKTLTSRPPRVTLWASLAAMLLVASVAGGGWVANASSYRAGVEAIEQTRENPPECFGAASVLDPACAGVEFGDVVLPSPGFAAADRPAAEECFVQLNDTRAVTCEFGVDDPDAPHIVLIGDSHAYQLLTSVDAMAQRNGWRVTTLFKGACPWSTAPLSSTGTFGAACEQWRQNAQRELEALEPDAVLTAGLATTPFAATDGESSYETAVAGYREAWRTMTDRGVPVVTVVDNPTWEDDPNTCLRIRAIAECAGDRDEVLAASDPIREAAEGMPGVTLLDFTEVYCDEEICSPVVGGANVYRDRDHLTVTFVDTLAPEYERALRVALGRDGSLTQ
ncbi:acyltransferase [Microbacterium sp. LRZ72]|uniref:acyltransferase family protein n=1 Tax=Microbacterium sp. LRZ72 TaxID=2942481 RepID=UPI0029AF6613|nr:acyltransferase family protein [Microbacterium sp. LRZ72]MDX2375514.1 acyltransferase [Microbacterium sp. LRZ72]